MAAPDPADVAEAITDEIAALPGFVVTPEADAAWLAVATGLSPFMNESGGASSYMVLVPTATVTNLAAFDSTGQVADSTYAAGNVPTSGQKAALAGTTGTPSVTNKYVTDTDARMTDARTPTAHAGTHAAGQADALSGDFTFDALRLNDLSGTFPRHVTADADGDLDDGLFWDDLVFPAVAVNLAGPSAPPAYNEVEMTVDFSPTLDNAVQFAFQMPHGWAEGTTVKFHAHWKPSNTNAGNVVWEWKRRWTNIGDVAGSWTTTKSTEAASGVQDKHAVGAILSVDGSGKTVSSILQIQLQRLAGTDTDDTFTGLAQVLSFDVHYQKDAPGSVPEGSKT